MPYIDWLGKDDVVHHHKEIAYKTIDCQDVVGDEDSENMIIKGDNLLALKSLLPYYAGAVKMIYIDPPYNTGNTSWVYNDNMDSALIKKWLNDTVNADDLSRSDKWLCMMYPRLKLLRELLKEDGVIFISIDDAEVAHLKLLCDEVFGKTNFMAQFIWKSGGTSSAFYTNEHEYILAYGKNIDLLSPIKYEGEPVYITDRTIKKVSVKNPASEIFFPKGIRFDGKDKQYPNKFGKTETIEITEGIFECKNGVLANDVVIKAGWTMRDMIRDWIDGKEIYDQKGQKVIEFFFKENGVLQYIKEKGTEHPNTIIENITTKQGTTEVKNIFSEKIFDFPKPTQLIRFLMKIADTDDIILDSFAGSGTTAHAVIEQNKADGGNRKFILIETLDYAKEITAERVKRVQQGYAFTGKDKTTLYEKKLTTAQVLKPKSMEKIATEVEALIEKEKANYDKIEKTFKENLLKVVGIKHVESFKEGLGGGFKYCELGEEIFDESGDLNPELSFGDIAKHIYFVEFKQPLGKVESEAPFVGSYKSQHLYFYEKQFKTAQLKSLVKTHEKYKQIIVYTRRCSISADVLKKHKITIRYIPYDIKDS